MLISLGHTTHPPDDVVDALLECHQRIRRFTALALAVAARPDLSAAEARDTCAQVERYFRQALPLHVRDEEVIVTPRIAGLRPDVDAALTTMNAEHAEHAPLLARLFEALRQPVDRPALHTAATALEAAFETHLQQEEQVLFPALRQLVSAELRKAMLVELRASRA